MHRQQMMGQMCATADEFDQDMRIWQQIARQEGDSPRGMEARAQLGALQTWRKALEDTIGQSQRMGPRGMQANQAAIMDTCSKAHLAIMRSRQVLAQKYGMGQFPESGMSLFRGGMGRAQQYGMRGMGRAQQYGMRSQQYGMGMSRMGMGRAQQYGMRGMGRMGMSQQYGTGRAQQYMGEQYGMGRAQQYGMGSETYGMGTEMYGAEQYPTETWILIECAPEQGGEEEFGAEEYGTEMYGPEQYGLTGMGRTQQYGMGASQQYGQPFRSEWGMGRTGTAEQYRQPWSSQMGMSRMGMGRTQQYGSQQSGMRGTSSMGMGRMGMGRTQQYGSQQSGMGMSRMGMGRSQQYGMAGRSMMSQYGATGSSRSMR